MVILAYKDIEENFKFVVLEVKKQVEDTLKVIESHNARLVDRIRERDDYIDNLKSLIENKSFSRIFKASSGDKQEIDFLRALLVITHNLEKIGDYSVNIGDQFQYLDNHYFIKEYDYRSFYNELFGAMNIIVKAFYKQDIKLALRICHSEINIDTIYRRNFGIIMSKMKMPGNTQNLITTLFIFQYLERMGDALLNIGEAIIFSIMGEKIKIREYRALEDTLTHTGLAESSINNLDYNGIWGTRSGCRIGSLNGRGGDKDKVNVFFKHGKLKKLEEEKQSIERWEKMFPGLAPKIFAFQKDKNSAALLLKYIKGITLQEVILTADKALLSKAYHAFQKTVESVWRKTKTAQKSNANFSEQILSRLDDVYRLHPQLKNQGNRIGDIQISSIEELLRKFASKEKKLDAPFSVFIHGDLNTNNIIYNPDDKKIHYIDLHRSRNTDFAQDVSVFMVSNFRLPVFDPGARERLDGVIRNFFNFSASFASDNGDATFQARLALGLVRSFITSTRYEYRANFAKIMFLRGVYILDKLIASSGGPWEDFVIPEEAFIY